MSDETGPQVAGLAATNRLYQAVLEGTELGIIATDLDGKVTLFNRGAEVILGYLSKEVVGQANLTDFHLPQELAGRATELSVQTGMRVTPGIEALIALPRLGVRDSREWTWRRKDGVQLLVRVNLSALRYSGGTVNGFLIVAEDLTSRKRAEVALQATEKRLLDVLGKADCLLWEAEVEIKGEDWDWHFEIQPSALYRRLTGKAETGSVAGLWYQFEIPQIEEMNLRCRKAIESGQSGYEQEFYLLRGGAVTWIHESVSITDTGRGRFWLVGIATDISERKRSGDALRQTEEQFRSAFEDAGIGMALVGLDGRWLRVNRALCELVGYPAEILLQKTFQELTHPDDLENDLAHVRDLIAGQSRSYRMEKRYLHRNGGVVWIRLTVSLVRRPSGEPIHFVGQMEDITPYRAALTALRESEERRAPSS